MPLAGAAASRKRKIAWGLANWTMCGTRIRAIGITVRAHARRRLREMGEEGAALARRDGWVRELLQRRE